MRSLIAVALFLITACSPSPPPDSDIIAYFTDSKQLILELAQLGVAHPTLRRVEPSLKKYASYYGHPTVEDLAAEQRAYIILAALKVDYVSYWRNGALTGNPLVYIEVPFYRWGLSLGGYGKSLRFFPACTKDPPQSDREFKYKPLNEQCWYIFESDTR
jgi:hypothetical protein